MSIPILQMNWLPGKKHDRELLEDRVQPWSYFRFQRPGVFPHVADSRCLCERGRQRRRAPLTKWATEFSRSGEQDRKLWLSGWGAITARSECHQHRRSTVLASGYAGLWITSLSSSQPGGVPPRWHYLRGSRERKAHQPPTFLSMIIKSLLGTRQCFWMERWTRQDPPLWRGGDKLTKAEHWLELLLKRQTKP